MAFYSLPSEEQFLVLLASMFESEPIPEIVFKILLKSVHSSLGQFARYSEHLQTSNFIQVQSEVAPWSTIPRRSWWIDTAQKKILNETKKRESALMFTNLCQQAKHDDIVATLFVIYGQVPWRDQAASKLGIPRSRFEDGHYKAKSLPLASIKPLVWLLHAEFQEEWEKQSHQLAKKVLHKYLLSAQLHNNALVSLLAKEETFLAAFGVLLNIQSSQNAPTATRFPSAFDTLVMAGIKLSHGKSNQLQQQATSIYENAMENAILNTGSYLDPAVEILVNLMEEGMSSQVQSNAAWTLGQISIDPAEKNAAVAIGSFPHVVDKLVGLLQKGMSAQVQEAASWTLGQMSTNVVENAIKIGSFPRAVERLVGLLEKEMSAQVQRNAAWTLGQISSNVVENAVKIGSFPHALERLVELLEIGTSAQVQETASWTLRQISGDRNNAIKIGSSPHAVERLLILLEEGRRPQVQLQAVLTLGQICKEVAKNAEKIASHPHGVERLVGFLGKEVSPQVQGAAAWTLRAISASLVENTIKIGSFPDTVERLVEFFLKENSQAQIQEAVAWTLEEIEQLSELVQEFIAECKKGDEGGFLVSAEWLENLEEHEKEVLLSVLWREGFSEIYHTSTTILYKKLNEDNANINNPTPCNDASFAGDISDPTGSSTNPVQEEIQSSVLDTPRKAANLSSLKGKEEVTAPAKQLSTSMRSFIAALKEKGTRSYCVSTEWLSKLHDNEQLMLRSICMENRYVERYPTSSTTNYERIEDHVSTCHDRYVSTYTDESTKDADKNARRPSDDTAARSGEHKKPRYLHPKDQQSFIEDESGIRTTSAGQPHLKSDDSGCVPQLLEVTCAPPPRSSTGTSTSSQDLTAPQGCIRLPCGDSYVILPSKHEDYKIATEVEQTFRITHYRYQGESELIPEDVSLQFSAVTTVSCCMKRDKNDKEIRVKFSKLKGQIKHVAGPRILDLVLESVRTNVDAGIYLGDRKTEHIDLGLEGSNPRPVADGVWLALSGEDPHSVPPGSLNLELRCNVSKRRIAQLQSHLLFQDTKSPVTIEGDICGSVSDKEFVRLFVRYQLVPSYSKPCGIMGKPFTRTVEEKLPVDFDCVLNYRATKKATM